MKRIIVCFCLFCLPVLFSCIKSPAKTCSDHIQNQGETGEDCGGPCSDCATCSDNIQNQNEDGVDCGGECGACTSCEDGIKNRDETGIDCGNSCEPCNPISCNTPPGIGEIVYLPVNGRDSLNYIQAFIDTSTNRGEKFEVVADFKFYGSSLYNCRGFDLKFFGAAILDATTGNTQVFITANPDLYDTSSEDYRRNKCVMTLDMPMTDLVIQPGGKVYVTKLGANKYNLRCCTLPVPKTLDYTFNTNFSANIIFSIN